VPDISHILNLEDACSFETIVSTSKIESCRNLTVWSLSFSKSTHSKNSACVSIFPHPAYSPSTFWFLVCARWPLYVTTPYLYSIMTVTEMVLVILLPNTRKFTSANKHEPLNTVLRISEHVRHSWFELFRVLIRIIFPSSTDSKHFIE
jgi:hypothetical protein